MVLKFFISFLGPERICLIASDEVSMKYYCYKNCGNELRDKQIINIIVNMLNREYTKTQ